MKRNRRFTILAILAAVLLLLAIGCDSGGSSDGGGDEADFKYSIGDTGPAGGLIFYVDKANEYDWTYMEVAPKPAVEKTVEWGDEGTPVAGGRRTGIGDGSITTSRIVAHMEGKSITGTAAQYCDDLVIVHEGTTYDDWFLPTKDEAKAIWDNLVDDGSGANSGVGEFVGVCWTSSEYSDLLAVPLDFNSGGSLNTSKSTLRFVRAVRAF